MVLFCLTMGTIEIAYHLVQHNWLNKEYIKDNFDSGAIDILYMKVADQSTDMMIHNITSGPFYASSSKLRMCELMSQL